MQFNGSAFADGDGSSWNPPYGPALQIIGWLLAGALSLGTILGNALVLLAYRLERSISKQLNNRFIVSLAISDLIIGIEGIPFFTAYVINGDKWPLGAIACETWLFLDYTLCLVSILTVLLITADRYLSVCHTAKYLKWQTPMKVQILIFASWILPALIFGLMIYGWPWIGGEDEQIQATTNGECYAPFLSNPYVNMGMYLSYYWTTLVAMLILYKGIHKAAKKLEKRSKAKEHRHIALLLTQRLGTQVGVGLMLHAKRYHEEIKKTKPNDAKDSGYTTNNTLSTNDSGELRRNSFAILARAVQSTQKLTKFRARGTTFSFRVDKTAKECDEKKENLAGGRQLNPDIQHHGIQPHLLESVSERNSSSQNTELRSTDIESNEKEVELAAAESKRQSSVKPIVRTDQTAEMDDDFIFPQKIHQQFVNKIVDEAAVISLSTGMFNEESLSSVLNFNPSVMTGSFCDPTQSDTSSQIIESRKIEITNAINRNCSSLTHKERNKNIENHRKRITGSLRDRHSKSPRQTPLTRRRHTESAFLKLSPVKDNGSKCSIEIETIEKVPCQPSTAVVCSSPQSHITTTTLSIPTAESRERRQSSQSYYTRKRKSSQLSLSDREQRSPEQAGQAGVFTRLRQRLSIWLQSSLRIVREGSSVTTHDLPNFMHSSKSFSSMSSVSSSVAPVGTVGAQTRVSLMVQPAAIQQQIPMLTVTRDSVRSSQLLETAFVAEGNALAKRFSGREPASPVSTDNEANSAIHSSLSEKRGSGFLNTLFAPISTFQRRRKRTKAERRAHKAFRTITFIVGLFAILWSPYYIVATIYGFCQGSCIPTYLYNLSYYMCYLNSSLNPFAYALANRQFRSAFMRILRGNFHQT